MSTVSQKWSDPSSLARKVSREIVNDAMVTMTAGTGMMISYMALIGRMALTIQHRRSSDREWITHNI